MTNKATLPQPTGPLLPEPEVSVSQPKRVPMGRSKRRPEEDVASPRYITMLQRLGPRDGESQIAFAKRLGAAAAARKVIVKVWHEQHGDKARVSIALGIPRNALAYELRVVGLDSDMLDAMFRGREIPE